MYAHGMLIRQVLRGVVLLNLRVSWVPLPVDYSRLKPDDTSGFKNHLLAPPFLSHSSLAPSSKPHINNIRKRLIRTASEFGQAQTPVSHFFCGSSSLAPLPSIHITFKGCLV